MNSQTLTKECITRAITDQIKAFIPKVWVSPTLADFGFEEGEFPSSGIDSYHTSSCEILATRLLETDVFSSPLLFTTLEALDIDLVQLIYDTFFLWLCESFFLLKKRYEEELGELTEYIEISRESLGLAIFSEEYKQILREEIDVCKEAIEELKAKAMPSY